MNTDSTPRSVQFIDSYYPVIDGVIETVNQYARRMGAPVVCPEMKRNYREKFSFPYPLLTSRTIRIPFSRYACAVPALDGSLASRIAEQRPEILHIHSPSLLGKYAVTQGRKMKIPVVGTFHSKCYDATLEFTKSRAIARFVTRQVVKLYESCDAVWACSEETGETLRSYGFRGQYSVMPNGTDAAYPDNAEALKARAAALYPLPRDRRVLLFVGQQIWYKNQRLILDAFRLLCDRSDGYFLVMVGAGKDEQDIRRYAESLGLTDRQTCFTGLIQDRGLLNGIYLNADLLFFPSVFDNAPLVLREAAVMGVPTLAVEGSNAAGAIQKNFNGYTAEGTPTAMAKEIERIFAAGDIGRVGKNAQQTIPVSWERIMAMVAEQYRRVIAEYGK